MWKAFFEELGAEIVPSGFTNKSILDNGVKACVDEACLPIKLFHGHVLALKDKVDLILIPRFTSVSRGKYICPKFGGLPDMIKQTISDLPVIIDTEVNLRGRFSNSFKAFKEAGNFITSDNFKIKKAYERALSVHKDYNSKQKNNMLPSDILTGNIEKCNYEKYSEIVKDSLTVVLMGHVYNICDSFLNMRLVEKLRNHGVSILTIEMMDEEIINAKSKSLSKKMFWDFGSKALGTSLCLHERNDIDGMIYIMSFGCGIDSFICDLVEKNIRRNTNIPFMVLTLDEHSGEAGLNTRLEAFLDMIEWRKRDDNYLSAHRERFFGS